MRFGGVEICRRHGEAAIAYRSELIYDVVKHGIQSYCTRTVDGRKRRRRARDVKIFENQGMDIGQVYYKNELWVHIRILRTAFYANNKHFRKTEPSRHQYLNTYATYYYPYNRCNDNERVLPFNETYRRLSVHRIKLFHSNMFRLYGKSFFVLAYYKTLYIYEMCVCCINSAYIHVLGFARYVKYVHLYTSV